MDNEPGFSGAISIRTLLPSHGFSVGVAFTPPAMRAEAAREELRRLVEAEVARRKQTTNGGGPH
jgi:hypothetical protein